MPLEGVGNPTQQANAILIISSLKTSLFRTENAISSITSVNSTLHHQINFTLDEEIPIGKTIGRCKATDDDKLGDLTFELDPWNAYFRVDKGKLRVILSEVQSLFYAVAIVCSYLLHRQVFISRSYFLNNFQEDTVLCFFLSYGVLVTAAVQWPCQSSTYSSVLLDLSQLFSLLQGQVFVKVILIGLSSVSHSLLSLSAVAEAGDGSVYRYLRLLVELSREAMRSC